MTASPTQSAATAVSLAGAQQVSAPRSGGAQASRPDQAAPTGPAKQPLQGTEARGEQQPVSEEGLERAVTQLNEFIQNMKRSLQFSVDKDSGRTVIKVVDPATDEVIRQIPPEEVMAISRQLEGSLGILLKAEA